jgi:hypothetical protein
MRAELCCDCTNLESEITEDLLERFDRERPWDSLGDGQTLEDLIYQKLAEQGAMQCPHCGRPVEPSEESLGRMSMEMLAQL